MHKGRAIERAKRIYRSGYDKPLFIVPCGCGEWTVKTGTAIKHMDDFGAGKPVEVDANELVRDLCGRFCEEG